MSTGHTDIGPELRKLAQAIVDGIDPAVRAAATLAASGGTGKCQQVWCPVCALAAVVNGEQHPLVTVIANHSVALLEVIQSIVDDMHDAADPAPEDDPPGGGLATDPAPPSTNGNGAARTGYQAIPVTVQE
ncbi:hypothetical protein BST16_22825 [Mycobacterium asiaticum DSM 44297]|nr:hypothetical protein A5661_01115 [Mycobacterium asiaticum]OBJ49222.1 hypothetical protein A9W94_03045 [Mycobacterium asiaticum]ORA10264.1 hypothetical protein BST16_22825 [Mycobacterium asiaticum DSM 44297]